MRIRSPLLTKFAGLLAVVVARAIFATCRKHIHAVVPGSNPYQSTGSQRYLFCIWHDMLLMTLFCGLPREMAGLVSRHQDGSYLADGMEMVGITPVRGSTSRGGAKAIRELMETAREKHIAITPDGPRGPRRQMKKGIVFLASHSGRSIVPVAHSSCRAWRIPGSWTDLMVPKPFSKVFALGGEPIQVPPDLSRDELDRYEQIVQDAMDCLQAKADRMAAGIDFDEPVTTSDLKTAA